MKKQLTQVAEFHTAFNEANAETPILISEKQALLRFKLIDEESKEYLKACQDEDMVEIADAVGDQLYIVFGTILKHGLQHKIEEVFDRIHAANMSKLDADGKPVINGENGIYDERKPVGKILKSDLYQKVDLTDLFPKPVKTA